MAENGMGAVYALVGDLNAGVMGGVAPAAPPAPLWSLDEYVTALLRNGHVRVEVADAQYGPVVYEVWTRAVFPYVSVMYSIPTLGIAGHPVNNHTWGTVFNDGTIENTRLATARSVFNAILGGVKLYSFDCGQFIRSHDRTTT